MFMCVCICMYICICIYTYMYIYEYMYISDKGLTWSASRSFLTLCLALSSPSSLFLSFSFSFSLHLLCCTHQPVTSFDISYAQVSFAKEPYQIRLFWKRDLSKRVSCTHKTITSFGPRTPSGFKRRKVSCQFFGRGGRGGQIEKNGYQAICYNKPDQMSLEKYVI